MRRIRWLLLTVVAACQPLPSEPRYDHGGGLILEAYNQRLLAQFTTNGTGLGVYTSWATISGTDAKVISTENKMSTVLGDVGTYTVLDVASTSTQATDPNRMRKVLTIQVRNNAAADRPLQFYIERTGTGWTGTYLVTPAFNIPVGGMLMYAPETGWVVYDANGKTGIAGPQGATGPTGPTGAAGSDGWSYVKLANDHANSAVTLADVTGMNFSAALNTNYEVEVFGNFTSAATTTGMALALTTPAGATVAGVTWHPVSATALGSAFSRASGAVTGATASVDAVAPNFVPFTSKWVVKNANTAGIVQLQLRSEVAASAVTLLGGSVWLKYRTIL